MITMLASSFDLPSFAEFRRVLLLSDYNTRLVVLSTTALGIAAGLIGSFLLLRKRSLMGDALSHATLPGIAIAFILMVHFGGSGKSLPGLLAGAAVFGLLGVGAVLCIRGLTRLKDDAALGIVLSVFFGFGAAILGLIQKMPEGSAAGLESFIYGKTASMIRSDLILILSIAAVVLVACLGMYKEFKLLSFDEGYARSQGWPVTWLDIVMMTLVTTVTVIGLQAVGLILVIALLIIPPAAARFWTERLHRMMIGAAVIGAFSGWIGASISALLPKLPAGAVIVLVAASIFLFSMIFGSARGVLVRYVQHFQLSRKVADQHLLRALYEHEETTGRNTIDYAALLAARSWNTWQLGRNLSRAERHGLVSVDVDRNVKLTTLGMQHAMRVVRNHRLWEMYLITHADIAPSHVDRDADMIEHVLGADLIHRLELLLEKKAALPHIPVSPHTLDGGVKA